MNELVSLSPEAWPVFLNVGAGLLMFLLVTVFLHAARRRGDDDRPEAELRELEKFIFRKKVIALGLTVLLLGVAVQRVIEFLFAAPPGESQLLFLHRRLHGDDFHRRADCDSVARGVGPLRAGVSQRRFCNLNYPDPILVNRELALWRFAGADGECCLASRRC